MALIEGWIANDLDTRRAKLGEHQLQSMLRADEIGGEGAVEEKTMRLEAVSGGACLLDSLGSQIWVLPPSKNVFQVPVALAVAQEHENPVHYLSRVSCLSDSHHSIAS